MPSDVAPKQLKLKRGDVQVRTRGGLTTLVWKDRREVYMLTNMDPQLAEGNFCDDSNRPVKPYIVEWYNQHMGYIDNSDHMANSYLISRCTIKWTMKFFFHLLDLKVLNIWIPLSSCGTIYNHRDFRHLLVRKLERAKIAPPPDWLEDQVRAQKMFCDSRVAITKSGQRNHPPNCVVISVLHAVRERAQCINAPDVMWACAWCHISRNITLK